jgi:universal stress protein A
MTPIRTILVATDFSAHAERALDAAIDLARKFEASIHVAHAFDIPMVLVSPYEVALPDPYLTETRAAASRKLEAAVKRAAASGRPAQGHLLEAPAAPAITRAAEELGADLIVMGTRGNTGLKHIVLGSVAERTLRLAPCSVLTVKGT